MKLKKINLIKRDYDIDEYERLVLVGIRRAGKSFLLYQKIKDNLKKGIGWDEMLYINFEDERLGEFTAMDFDVLLEIHFELYGKRPMLFLDEVQNISGWEKFARRIADQKYKVFIAGSNAQMLSNEIQTTLGGRYFVKENTRLREVSALKKIHKVLPVKECFIVTYDEEEVIVEDDITINVVPIWKWLVRG